MLCFVNISVEDLIESLLSTSDALEILPENDMHLALHDFVEKEEPRAFSTYVYYSDTMELIFFTRFVEKILVNTQNYLKREDPTRTQQPEYIHTLVNERTTQIREKARLETRLKVKTDDQKGKQKTGDSPGNDQKGKKASKQADDADGEDKGLDDDDDDFVDDDSSSAASKSSSSTPASSGKSNSSKKSSSTTPKARGGTRASPSPSPTPAKRTRGGATKQPTPSPSPKYTLDVRNTHLWSIVLTSPVV